MVVGTDPELGRQPTVHRSDAPSDILDEGRGELLWPQSVCLLHHWFPRRRLAKRLRLAMRQWRPASADVRLGLVLVARVLRPARRLRVGAARHLYPGAEHELDVRMLTPLRRELLNDLLLLFRAAHETYSKRLTNIPEFGPLKGRLRLGARDRCVGPHLVEILG